MLAYCAGRLGFAATVLIRAFEAGTKRRATDLLLVVSKKSVLTATLGSATYENVLTRLATVGTVRVLIAAYFFFVVNCDASGVGIYV